VSDPLPVDPATREVGARMLAYLHPLIMLVTIGLLALALKEGLGLRKSRLRSVPSTNSRTLHTRVAKIATTLLLVGAAAGPISAVWLRGWEALATLHAWVALAVGTVCLSAACLGLRLESGRMTNPEIHGWLGLATLFGAVGAFMTGFVLLP
jgi:hypothetical protein